MDKWKEIKIEGIAKIEKCVAEFNVWELNLTPWAKFKVKVFEDSDGKYTGYTNLRLKSAKDGSAEGAVGFGATIEEALEDTIRYFLRILRDRDNLAEEDFDVVDPYDY